jgi:tetratricopeptide (TPR) repeat protein
MSSENIETLTKLLLEEKERYDKMTFTTANVNQLDSSFMYSVLLKEILLELEDDDETAKQDFVDYCRYEHAEDAITLRTIDRFEHDYCQDRVIYWYSQPCFFFELRNRSLRTQNIEILVRITFMLRHLHKQIEHLHSGQMSSMNSTCFHVYRGQGMERREFDQKVKNQVGSLLSFSSFLSTSRNADVAEIFVLRNDADSVAVLFDITVDGSISRCPFAVILNESAVGDEEEILFSMQSVFRIQTVEEDVQNAIWRVSLSLTSENDQQLHMLTTYLRNKIDDPSSWNRLENLLIEMGKWSVAKPLIEVSLSSSLEKEKSGKQAYIHQRLGVVNTMIGDYPTAIEHYKKSLTLHSSDDILGLALTHCSIGSTLEEQEKRSEALNEYKCALSFIRKLDQPNIEALTTIQNNIAGVLRYQGKLIEALDLYNECLRLGIEHLPPLHPDIGTLYVNIASIYDDMNEWEIALKYELKALNIEQRSLPSDHSSIATTYSNIALTLHALNRKEEAVSYLRKAIAIFSKHLPLNDTSLLLHQTLLNKFNHEI